MTQVCIGQVERKTSKILLTSSTFCNNFSQPATTSLLQDRFDACMGGKMCNIRVLNLFCSKVQNKLHVFVARFTVTFGEMCQKNMITKKLTCNNQFLIMTANSQLLIACLSSASSPLLTEL